MNVEFFIARGILSKDSSNFSRPIVRLSVLSIALGLAVMILAVAVTSGFKTAITDKVIGFGSHIQITSFDLNRSYETSPVSIDQPFYPGLMDSAGIRHIQVFATKSGLIKTTDQIQGIILKGISTDFDWSFFKDKIVEGQLLVIDPEKISDDILISRKIADRMQFKLGDEVRAYFVNPEEMAPRGRKFRIAGIYESGLEEFDNLYLIGDIRHVQRLNNWDKSEISGFEVFVDDYRNIDHMADMVYQVIGYNLNITSIKEMYPQIFEWLNLQDMNVIIILTLMIAVAAINMISTLLILILEKTNMIGVLKALGATNRTIRKIFLYNASFIIGRGLVFGNIIGLGIAFLQLHFQLFRLDQESYYVPYVPVQLEVASVLLLNLGTLLLCLLFMLIPSYIIMRISPVRAIRWD
ncbi:MAG TPA: FtsX-like permease family protein [Bacteroidales bacterium]|nr:FtsX-like permease family protein [Bacteroidales bacterium]HRW97288.1 FtsX-like permease family protein [Bacteroidales bacterium]